MKNKNKLLIVICLALLLLTACNKEKPNLTDPQPEKTLNKVSTISISELVNNTPEVITEEIETWPIFWSEYNFLALSYLGDGDEGVTKDFHKTTAFLDYVTQLGLQDEILMLELSQNPKEAWFLVPSPFTSKVSVLENDDSEEPLVETIDQALLIYSDQESNGTFVIETSFETGEPARFKPSKDSGFLAYLRSNFYLYDISPEVILERERFFKDESLFSGYWQGFSLNDPINYRLVQMIFEPFASEEATDEETEIKLFNLAVNYLTADSIQETWEGEAYLEAPADYTQGQDEQGPYVYFYLYRSVDPETSPEDLPERYQLFGQYFYSFWHPNVLYLSHVDYDPIGPGDEHLDYVLWRHFTSDKIN